MKKLMPISDLLIKSFQIYKKRGWILTRMFLIYLIFMITIFVIFGLLVGGFELRLINYSVIIISAILMVIIAIVSYPIIITWINLSAIVAIKEHSFKAEECLVAGWSKFPSGFWVLYLTGLAIFGGTILFIIPGIIFAVWFAFSLYVLVLKNVRGIEALKISKKLVSGYWWPVFGRILFLQLIFWAITMILHNFLLASLVGVLFVMPFSFIYYYVLYEDLQKIKGH